METRDTASVYDFKRWYAYAQAESTKALSWSVNRDALYVARFLVKNWVTEERLPRSDLTLAIFKPLCGALSRSVEQYTVRGITFMHVVSGAQVRVLDTVVGIPTLGWMDTDAGSWIVDIVFRSEAEGLLIRPDIGAWQAYVAGTLSKMGYGAPTVYTMGIVTLHCGPGALVCRLVDPDEDPDPVTTAEAETFWMGMPDLVRSTLPKADAEAGKPPSLVSLDAFNTSLINRCVGVGGLQMAVGFHDHVNVASSLIPVFACSDGVTPWVPDLPGIVPRAIAGLSTNQKIVIGIFVLAGFVIGLKSHRMWTL